MADNFQRASPENVKGIAETMKTFPNVQGHKIVYEKIT